MLFINQVMNLFLHETINIKYITLEHLKLHECGIVNATLIHTL